MRDSRLVRRILDACLVAGALLAAIDVALLAGAGGGATPAALALAVAIPIAAAAAMAGTLAILARLTAGVDRALRPALLRWCAPLSAVLLAAPLWLAVLRLASRPGLVLVIAAAAAVGVVLLARRIARGMRSPSAFLAGAVAATWLVLAAVGSVVLIERLHPSSPGSPLAFLIVACLAAIVLAAAVYECIAAGSAPPPRPRAIAAVAIGLAVALASTATRRYPYEIAHFVAVAAAFLLLVAGLVSVGMPGRWWWRAPPIVLAMAGVVHLGWFLALPSPTPWILGARTHVSRQLLGRTQLLRVPLGRFVAMLAARSEASAPRTPWRGAPARPDRDLSLLLVTVDALRYDHCGYAAGVRRTLTPRMDELAARSVRFHRAYAQGGWTSISLPALFWSRHPKDLRFVPIYEDGDYNLYFERELRPSISIRQIFQSPIEEPSSNLPAVLSQAGLATVAIPNDGVTNYFDPRLGFSRGFERTVHPRAELRRASPGSDRIPDDAFTSDLVIRALQSLRDRRFFVWTHFFDTHGPHEAPPGSPLPGYAGEILAADAQLGRILDALDRAGRRDDTIVVVASDHGEIVSPANPALGMHGVDLRDVLMRVPLLVAIPGVPGRDVAAPVGLIDVAPTVLGAMGLAVPPTMDGDDLAPLLRGEAAVARPVFFETWYRRQDGEGMRVHQIGAVLGTDKVVMDRKAWTFAFFDLAADPGETRNLFVAGDDPGLDRFLGLAARLVGWYGGASGRP